MSEVWHQAHVSTWLVSKQLLMLTLAKAQGAPLIQCEWDNKQTIKLITQNNGLVIICMKGGGLEWQVQTVQHTWFNFISI